ncbi:hypothetical protein BV20DRAFT_956208 [Pilatotrama ljubarskyi]|nr:hypothetical protein BV20DRAFT_956208 [Pilatotrama ljubarskyi]
MGRFKGLGEGSGSYIIPDEDWVEIARETMAAFWSAEIWAFWFIYIAPVVLRGRFEHEKYYDHMCDLISIMKTTLQFEITRQALETLREQIVRWVEQYEEYYYQYDSSRLSTCLLVVHGLLHLVDDILYAGPCWATWTFFMERFCGSLKRALRSRTHPWANLDRRAVNLAHAAHLRARYDLEEELALLPRPRRPSGPTAHPLSYLRNRCLPKYDPSKETRIRIARYLVSVVGGQRAAVAKALPRFIPAWGGVRIGTDGDTIRAVIGSRSRLGSEFERNASFVRYEVLQQRWDGGDERLICYGELQAILECALPPGNEARWKDLAGTTVLLALITPCNTRGCDGTRSLALYKDTLAPVVVDLRTVQAVVGRVKSRGSWGIVDRSNGLARTVFVNEDDLGLDSEEHSEDG